MVGRCPDPYTSQGMIARTAAFTHCLPLLITGITGVAGFNALHYFQRRYPGQVIGIGPPQPWGAVAWGSIRLNTDDRRGVLPCSANPPCPPRRDALDSGP